MVRTNEMTTFKKKGVTPAEAMILEHTFRKQAGGRVITEAVETEPLSPRRAALEAARLQSVYRSSDIFEKLWPGANKRLPQTFAEAQMPDGVPIRLVSESAVQIAPSPDEFNSEQERLAKEEEAVAEAAPESTEPAPVKEHWKTREKRLAAEAAAKAAESQPAG